MRTFKPKLEKQPVINEGLDRQGRFQKDGFPEGSFPDEDQELVDANHPRHKYRTPEDVADNSYLTYGEDGDEKEEGEDVQVDEVDDETDAYNQLFSKENHLLSDDEIEELAAVREQINRDQNETNPGRDEVYTMNNLNPKNSGKIGAAHISAEDGKIIINREPSKTGRAGVGSVKETESFILPPLTEKEKQTISEKYENLEAARPSGKMRAVAHKAGLHSKIEKNDQSRHGQSHRSKKKKPDIALLRKMTEDTHEHPLDDVVF